jgi:hypothetical protein
MMADLASTPSTAGKEISVAEQLTLVRTRHIALMAKTLAILQGIFAAADPAEIVTLRDPDDGPRGWTPLEVLCHLRDFDEFFLGRARMMLAERHADLPGYDHERLAVERAYNSQAPADVLAALTESRGRAIEFYQALTATGWSRTGIHPARGYFTMTDAVMQVGLHDATHIEQIVRTLRAS